MESPKNPEEDVQDTTAEESASESDAPKATSQARSKMKDAEARAKEGFEDFVDAARKGARDAAEAAQNTMPAVKQGVAKGTYVCCYYLAFATVYSACLAMEFVPEDSPIRHGFRDGAEAATAAHEARKTQAAENASPAVDQAEPQNA